MKSKITLSLIIGLISISASALELRLTPTDGKTVHFGEIPVLVTTQKTLNIKDLSSEEFQQTSTVKIVLFNIDFMLQATDATCVLHGYIKTGTSDILTSLIGNAYQCETIKSKGAATFQISVPYDDSDHLKYDHIPDSKRYKNTFFLNNFTTLET